MESSHFKGKNELDTHRASLPEVKQPAAMYTIADGASCKPAYEEQHVNHSSSNGATKGSSQSKRVKGSRLDTSKWAKRKNGLTHHL